MGEKLQWQNEAAWQRFLVSDLKNIFDCCFWLCNIPYLFVKAAFLAMEVVFSEFQNSVVPQNWFSFTQLPDSGSGSSKASI